MDNLLWLLPAVACPLGMVLMMWLMGKGMRGKPDQAESLRSIEELRAAQQRLATEIESLEPGAPESTRHDHAAGAA